MPRLFILVIAATLPASCAAHGNIGDYIPHWAGGFPEATPPRPGTPEYDAFRQKQDVEDFAASAHSRFWHSRDRQPRHLKVRFCGACGRKMLRPGASLHGPTAVSAL
jgi:hypothetical protein